MEEMQDQNVSWKVVIAKLVTGETVLAKLDGENLRSVFIITQVNMQSQSPDQMQQGFALRMHPYFFPFAEDISVPSKHIVTYTENVPSDLYANYIQVTSGIVVPVASNPLKSTSPHPVNPNLLRRGPNMRR